MNRIIIILIICFFAIPVLGGCGDKSSRPLPREEKRSSKKSKIDNEKVGKPDEDDEKDLVDSILESMTIEEKVGQVFMPAFRYGKDNRPLDTLDESTKNIIKQFCLGGVILFSENIENVSQTKKLIKDMQIASKLPLFIAVDEEGGIVSRIGNNSKMGATKIPSSFTIGKTGDETFAFKVGQILGKELSSLGFNMNFAPVADVNTNPDNPVIGTRSFGSNPDLVAKMVTKEVEGIQSQNVSAVLKHFPGHGDTSFDTHTGQVVVNHTIDRLREIEFVPFKEGIKSGVDAIMTAHIKVPNVSKKDIPATMSKKILTNILREELDFNGLIITDALEMGAISKYWKADQAAIRAFKAGADVLLMPKSLNKAYNGLLGAVKQGRISVQRLDDSVKRILRLKQKRGILKWDENHIDTKNVLGNSEHIEIINEIIKKANQDN